MAEDERGNTAPRESTLIKTDSLGWRSSRVAVIGVVGAMLLPALSGVSVIAQPAGRQVLEDFRVTGVDGFPQGWKAQRSETRARESYRLHSEQEVGFLAVTRADQRVYKRVAWDPQAFPIVTWRWRLKPITALAITREMLRSRPSRRR